MPHYAYVHLFGKFSVHFGTLSTVTRGSMDCGILAVLYRNVFPQNIECTVHNSYKILSFGVRRLGNWITSNLPFFDTTQFVCNLEHKLNVACSDTGILY